jgi:transposase
MGRSTTSLLKISHTDIQNACEKAFFAGVDFHKRFSVITLGGKEANILSQHKLMNDEGEIKKFFLQHGPLVCAIENCRGIEWFVELVKACGCEVRVANTFAVKQIAQTAKKTDRVDSKILMELVARNYLPTVYQPTRNERILREKLRWRTKLMHSRTQFKNVAHATLDKEHKGAKLDSALGRECLEKESGLSAERHEQLQDCLKVVEFFHEAMHESDRALAHIAQENQDVQRLTTIPGIGNLSGLMLVAELGDITRFKSARHVAGYLGLVPRLYASADTTRLGRITKQGPGHLRRILVQDAWVAVRESEAFRQKYNSILKRRGKKTAVVAIARMIAEIAYHVLKDKTEFDEQKMTLG